MLTPRPASRWHQAPRWARWWLRIPSATITITLAISIPSWAQTPSHSKWPTQLKAGQNAQIKRISSGDSPYIYQTKHFELHSSAELNLRNTELFAATAESVPVALRRLPLPLLSMPQKGRAKIFIYPDEESFLKEGGSPNAAGTYVGRKAAVLLRADTFLTPPSRPGSKLPPKANYDLLVHEFTHLCMHGNLGYVPVWFSEGTAEYLAAAHQHKGNYDFSNIARYIRDRIKNHLPQEKSVIRLPSIEQTLALNHQSWQQQIRDGKAEDNYRVYASSLLIVHTLFHGGQKRRDATRTFIENCHKRTLRPETTNVLLPKTERNQLQKRIIAYWKPRGLHIEFYD